MKFSNVAISCPILLKFEGNRTCQSQLNHGDFGSLPYPVHRNHNVIPVHNDLLTKIMMTIRNSFSMKKS